MFSIIIGHCGKEFFLMIILSTNRRMDLCNISERQFQSTPKASKCSCLLTQKLFYNSREIIIFV